MERTGFMRGYPTDEQAQKMRDLLKGARDYKMTPQEIFEQRVSFVSEGKDKAEVRRQLIEAQGYPAEASERAAIVAFLRGADSACEPMFKLVARALADAIERGDHLSHLSDQGEG